jgi:hypothetical protein
MSQSDLELATEVRQRCPVTVQRLEDDGCAVGKEPEDAAGIDEVVDGARLQARRLRVADGRKRTTVADEPNRRPPEPSLRQDPIDVLERQQVIEAVRRRILAQQWSARPVARAERADVTDAALECSFRYGLPA